MREEVQRAADVRARQDRKPSAEPRPRNDWIRERLEELRKRDELLRRIGYIKTEEDGNE